ncbi:unnamed protein product [Prunus armeniaca]
MNLNLGFFHSSFSFVKRESQYGFLATMLFVTDCENLIFFFFQTFIYLFISSIRAFSLFITYVCTNFLIIHLSAGVMANALDEWMSSKDEFYIPQVRDDKKPKAGLAFKSLDETYKFYNDYAKDAGFSVKISKEKKKKETGEVFWKRYVCFKEGETDETWRKKKDSESTQIERERGNVCENCKAKLTIVYDGFNFVVKTFIEEHTHPLATPSRVHLLRSHRGVSDTKIKLVKKFSNVNIPLYQQFELLETQAGGHESVGFIERDLRNFERDEREKIKGHDAEMLYEYLKSEEDKDSDFFFKFDTDNNNRMTRCFWVDSVARKAYTHFGDVVVFDTTYNTNRYAMIFSPLVSVNHHGQTTIFGCGFLSNETFDSFVWLLETWLEAMKAPPIVIITDQNQAMTKAIAQVLPNMFHRYCV